jgi:hypothetical protein
MHPLINVEWTVNVFHYEVIKNGSDGGEIIFRTYGLIDVYDYLDIDFISPVAKAMTDQDLYFAPRFDDVNDPFNITELKNLNTTVVTDYILEPGKNYVKIETTYENTGSEEVFVPVGEYLNGGGEVMFLIPGLGFTPELMPQIQGDTPAVIYTGFENSGVSYGYFYDASDFMEKDEDGVSQRLKSTSLSYSGVTGVLLGEDFLKVLPLGNRGQPKVNFSIPANGKRTVTRYLVIGDGSGGSVFDAGLAAVGVSTAEISGTVINSGGNPVPGATVAVKNEEDSTIITYRTDAKGQFSGMVSTGDTSLDKAFGTGKYTISVYKRGYRIDGSTESGTCSPEEIDVRVVSVTGIECQLGTSGILELVGGVVDEDSGQMVPARMTVVGYVPSYRSETGGDFEDKIIFERPLGVVDVYYVNASGTIGIEGLTSVRLAPGKYELAFTRGVEYSMARISVEVSGDYVTSIGPVSLRKVIDTTGFISSDFHLHSIASPDSAMRPERRVLAAAGEGMDIIQSSDHDYLVDYGPYVRRLSNEGIIRSGKMISIVGDELSPNHIGHINVFPLEYDSEATCGGAIDWGYMPSDIPGPEPDLVMSPQDVVDHVRDLPGEHIIQINHIADMATSLFILGGWVTTPFYYDAFGIEPLTSYAEPVLNRLTPSESASNYPYAFGSSEMVITDVDSLELTIGPELHEGALLETSLPQWFNFLNLGYIFTATGDSDSHREIANPVGVPRNFVASSVDPADGQGSFEEFDIDDYVNAIRDHKIVVSAGPFIKAYISNEEGSLAGIGETIVGNRVKLVIDVQSPEWAWFDTVEIYANTEPVPADDENIIPLEGKAKDPAEFFAPYHVPKFYYQPTHSFSIKDKTLEEITREDGVIKVHLELEMNLDRDTWVVVFVRGTEDTEGYHSLFPFVTRALVDADNPSVEPEETDIGNIDMLSLTGAPAWAFTNPIFVDIDGDGFDSLYSKDWSFSGGTTSPKNKSALPVKRNAPIKNRSKSVSATKAIKDLL